MTPQDIGHGLVWVRGKVYSTRHVNGLGGAWSRVLSFCLDDPEQSDVVRLPCVPIGGQP